MKKFFPILILVLGALGLVFGYLRIDLKDDLVPPKPSGHLVNAIPMSFGVFEGKDIPLGATEEVARSAEKTLSVSEFMNRNYTNAEGLEFTLYISYWAQGKEPLARAVAHTPDRCWVLNGWKNIDDKRISSDDLGVGSLMPAYYREMEYKMDNGAVTKRNLWFWFVANGQRYDYGSKDSMMPSIFKYMENMIASAFENSPESYFIRIDTSSDLRGLLQDKDFRAILDSLGRLILYEKEES